MLIAEIYCSISSDVGSFHERIRKSANIQDVRGEKKGWEEEDFPFLKDL
jgi:hypothetical protein